MKEDKVIYVVKLNTDDHHARDYRLYGNTERTNRNSYNRNEYGTREAGCQYEIIRKNLIGTCKNEAILRQPQLGYFGFPKLIYAYHGTRCVTDVGVGSVKALIRKKVKKIYLPKTDDRGVGSSDLSSLIMRRTRLPKCSFYDHKKTSSKCVGGIVEYNIGCVLSQKLSPIIQMKSGATSPIVPSHNNNLHIESKKVINNATATTQNDLHIDKKGTSQEMQTKIKERKVKPTPDEPKNRPMSVTKSVDADNKEATGDYSSDSLVQHIHNLENFSEVKASPFSIDLIENKLEKEYRNIFSKKSKEEKPKSNKTSSEMKSTSFLKRRFEALRRGLSKKEDSKRNTTIQSKGSSHTSRPSHKDVSVVSDPPSLEARSFSNTKMYSSNTKMYDPISSILAHEKISNKRRDTYKASAIDRKNRGSLQWEEIEGEDSDTQGVKGMLKLWGKQFNLEEESHQNRRTPTPSICISKKSIKEVDQAKRTKIDPEGKKDRKFFFFKKKTKDKSKPYKNKNAITTGRCEVRDGLKIKIGTSNTQEVVKDPDPEVIPENYNDILRKAWFKKYLSQTVESKKSVNVRWNNKTYVASSSTVFELMDNVYKEAGVLLKSSSEINVRESSYYRRNNKKYHVNFANQNFEAWMIAKTLPDVPKELPLKVRLKSNEAENISPKSRIFDQKWFKTSKVFSRQIEIVLHSQNIGNLDKKKSSEYLTIDIPKGFFIDSNSENYKQNLSSEETVYNVIEYETGSEQKKIKGIGNSATGDHGLHNVEVAVNVKTNREIAPQVPKTALKTTPVHRDVIIQNSHELAQKRCDIVSVGIITHTELKETKKNVMKIKDTACNEAFDNVLRTNQNKREFAQSYLQEYYENWNPLGIDFFSWCVSDSHLNCCLETPKTSFNVQGDVTRSCPNMFDDFQKTTGISSCDTSSCSHFVAYVDDDKAIEKGFNSMRNKNDGTRAIPKDSIQVYKRRMFYAMSNKSKWNDADDEDEAENVVPSNEINETNEKTDKTNNQCPPRGNKTCWKNYDKPTKQKRSSKKHVSMTNCDLIREPRDKQLDDLPGILAFKGLRGCDTCKKSSSGIRTVKVETGNPAEIPPPPCEAACRGMEDPPCMASPSPDSPEDTGKPPHSPTSNDSPSTPPKMHRSPSTKSCAPNPRHKQTPTKSCAPDLKQKQTPTKACTPDPKHKQAPTKSSAPDPKHKESPLCPQVEAVVCPPRNLGSRLPKKGLKDFFAGGLPQLPKKGLKDFFSCGFLFGRKKDSSSSIVPQTWPHDSSAKRSKSEPKSSCVQSEDFSGMDKFPWPTNNQVSNQSLLTGPVTNLAPNENICFASPRGSTRSVRLIKLVNKNCCDSQQESPNCQGRSCLTPPSQCLSPPLTRNTSSPQEKGLNPTKPKLSGIHLKITPSKMKSSFKEDTMEKMKGEGCCIRLSSKEQITIRMKAQTASTEEIREGLNIKVQDDDGQTLYERRDYNQNACNHRSSVLGEIYNSNINIRRVHRVPTQLIGESMTSNKCCDNEIKEEKSDTSVANLIEIQFQMRVTQGDKTTEISIANDGDKDTKTKKKDKFMNNSPEEVYVVKNEPGPCIENKDIKNDINIRILIKNFKTKEKKENIAEDYSRKISEKFHTVSTGYSNNLCNQIDDKDFSVHRATVDLTKSNEKSNKRSKSDFIDPESISVIKSFCNTQNVSTTEIINEQYTTCKQPNISEKKKIVRNFSRKKIVSPNEISINNLPYDPVEKEKLIIKEEITNRTYKIEKGYLSDEDDVTEKTDITEKTDMTEKTDRTDKYDFAYKDDLTEKDDITTEKYELTEKDDITTEKDDITEKEDNTERYDLTDNDFTEDSDAKHLKENDVHRDWTMKDLEKVYRDIRQKKSFDQNYNAIVTSDTNDEELVLEVNTSNEQDTTPSIEMIIKPHTKAEKKEMLKNIFEKANEIEGKNKTRMRQLCEMSKMILTSDSSGHAELKVKSNELAKDLTYASLKPNYFRDSDSVSNCYKLEGESISENQSKTRRIYPTENCSGCSKASIVISSENEIMHGKCMCNTLATRLNVSKMIGGGGCCCNRTEPCKTNQKVECDMKSNDCLDLRSKTEPIFVNVETQHSKLKAHTSTDYSVHSFSKPNIIETSNVLQVEEITANIVKTEVERSGRASRRIKNVKEYPKKHFKRNTNLTISDEDKTVGNEPRNRHDRFGEVPVIRSSDILQSYATKKAVLEIYAEKTISKDGERLVAKLPRFVYDRENEIEMNFEAMATNTYKTVCKRNILMMSIKR